MHPTYNLSISQGEKKCPGAFSDRVMTDETTRWVYLGVQTSAVTEEGLTRDKAQTDLLRNQLIQYTGKQWK